MFRRYDAILAEGLAFHETVAGTAVDRKEILKSASERYQEKTNRQLELERIRAMDPFRSAVEKVGRMVR